MEDFKEDCFTKKILNIIKFSRVKKGDYETFHTYFLVIFGFWECKILNVFNLVENFKCCSQLKNVENFKCDQE